MNIYQKLVEVRKSVPYLKKEASSGSGSFGYNYVSSSQVMGAVRQKLDELNVLLVTKITDKRVSGKEKSTKSGNVVTNYEVELDLEFMWINADKPEETITIPWFGAGVDGGDNAKAIGKALTYAEKYFMLKEFNIATDNDDPDHFQDKAESMVRESPTSTQINDLMAKATEYATMRKQPVEAVYKALGAKEITKLTKAQAETHIQTVEHWITSFVSKQQQGA